MYEVRQKKINAERMENLFSRRGRFQVSKDLIRESPTLVMLVTARVLVTSANEKETTIEYEGYSYSFEEVKEGEAAPQYLWTVKPDTGGWCVPICKRLE